MEYRRVIVDTSLKLDLSWRGSDGRPRLRDPINPLRQMVFCGADPQLATIIAMGTLV
jgi:hypothetical protein